MYHLYQNRKWSVPQSAKNGLCVVVTALAHLKLLFQASAKKTAGRRSEVAIREETVDPTPRLPCTVFPTDACPPIDRLWPFEKARRLSSIRTSFASSREIAWQGTI